MNVQLLYKDGVLTAKMSGEIDHHSAQEIREAIDDTSQKVKPYCLRMDFSQISDFPAVIDNIRLASGMQERFA